MNRSRISAIIRLEQCNFWNKNFKHFAICVLCQNPRAYTLIFIEYPDMVSVQKFEFLARCTVKA